MPPIPWSLRWGLCVVGECTPEDDAHFVYAIHVYAHYSHTDRNYSRHWRQQSVIPFFIRLFHDTIIAVLDGVVARRTRDLSPAASRRFPMVLGDTAGAKCAQMCSLDAVRAATVARTMRRYWRASVLRGRPEHGLRVWECSTDYCWKQRHTIDTLCPTCAIRRYVHPASRRPTIRPRSNGWSCTTGVRYRGVVVS